jgi:predicted O-methyltransferase YrrM
MGEGRKFQGLNVEFILNLYEKYQIDLRQVREYQQELHREKGYSMSEKYRIYAIANSVLSRFGIQQQNKAKLMHPQFDDIEAEITYLLVREFKPKNIVEISPCGGWSTSWLLNAIKNNKFGELYSYDIVDDSTKTLPEDLTEKRWHFILGDIKENIEKLPLTIDYLFMDSDHSADFAQWYIQSIFPRIRVGIPISVHDVFHTAKPCPNSEGSVIIDWLEERGISYFTASSAKEKTVHNKIMSMKKELNIKKSIHFVHNNSAIFFIYK